MRAGIRAAVRETRGWLLLAGLLTLVPTGAANALTQAYNFTGGQATVTATYASQTIGAGLIPLTGTQVVFKDDAPYSLVSFDFDAAGPNVIPLSGIMTGTSITLSGVQIAPGVPYTNFSVTGGPTLFNYTVGGVDVTGTATLAGVINQPATPFGFSNPALSGQVQLGLGGTIGLNGITLGVISLPASGPFPGGDVTIKADIVFTGLVPEPGTALLLGSGLALIGARGRRSRRS